MKVYVVTKMEHDDDYKRPETRHTVIRVFADKEKAYEFAHNKQFRYMRWNKHLANEKNDEVKNRGLPTYRRGEKDRSWKVSYGKLIKLYDEVLSDPEFTMMASQSRFLVKEHKLK